MTHERFSVLLLEEDVLEYVKYKAKYNKYKMKMDTAFFYKNNYKEKKEKYYLLYIKKMNFIERNYRHVNHYTEFHESIEKPVEAYILKEPSAPLTFHSYTS